ncbi:MAG TPA: pitrilysin family protein [Allosphingosinicella sp.]
MTGALLALGAGACAQTGERPDSAAARANAVRAATDAEAALDAIVALPQPGATVPPIRYTSRTLPNGLRVFAIRDENSPSVAVQVWYGVGGRDDPRGRSGFAHLFEHLMFKSTRNMPPEMLDRLTEDVGGQNNAFTSEDVTGYHETVPANHLERLLWAEAERMGSLVVEPEFFASERDVVKEELRSRIEASPYGRLLGVYYPAISYSVHPYARPVAGSIADLDAATIDDVRAFHATYYRPDNAVLVVAGNFDEAALNAWVDRYFGPIRRPDRPIPRVEVTEPERTRATTHTVYEPNTPLPAVMVSYPVPSVRHEDAAALQVLDGILSTGESSRLHRALVYEQRIASQASSFPDTRIDQGNLAAYAILSPGQDPQRGLAALRAEIARLRDTPVTAAELDEAKNELLTSALRERETAEGRASAIADAVMIDGDAEAANRRLAEIAAVTPADIQRVAQRWLRDDRSAAILYLPEEMRPNPQAGDRIALAPTVATRPLETPPGVRVVSLAPEAERVRAPEPGPARVTPIPAPVTQRLANGLTVVTVTRRDLPLVSASVVVVSGAASDPQGRAGRASLTAALLSEGTATRSATEIDRAVEALGTSIGAGAASDGMALGLTVRSDNLDAAMELVSDVARNPAFSAEELERQRAQAIDAFTVTMGDPGSVSRLVAMRALYGLGSYGHPQGGTAASLRALTREDARAAYARAWKPSNATLVLAGDIDPAAARALAERHFGSWADPADVAVVSYEPVRPRGTIDNVIVVDMPDAGQAAVAVARGTLRRADPNYYRTLLANAVLGGGYSSRLNQEIRIRRGLAYGAGSSIDARARGGAFVAATQTRNETAPEVLGLILAEMRRLGAAPVPAAELDTRRAVLLGGFGRNAETTAGLADIVGTYVLSGVGPEEIGRYQDAVLGVDAAGVRAAATEMLAPEGATMVIVGNARTFIDRLRRERRNVTVIPIGELNLDSPTLR